MESVTSSIVMDIFHTSLCICSCFETFRYRLVTCFEISFGDQICMYPHAVHFIISERGKSKLNITFTKNLFQKEPGLMQYDPILLGDTLKHWELVTHRHSDISRKTWVFSNTTVRVLSSTSNLAILHILYCYVVFYDPNAQYLPVVGGFCQRKL